MFKKRKVLGALAIFIIIFLMTLSYFINVLSSENEAGRAHQISGYEAKILMKLYNLPKYYHIKPEYYDNITETFVKSLKRSERDMKSVWQDVNAAVSKQGLFKIANTYLGDALHALQTGRIIKADLDKRGTQLKLLLTLEGGATVIFKPKWYFKEKVIQGPVYAGKDRHVSEILAFYLSAVLNKPFVPISVQRQINLNTEIVPVATEQLLQTKFIKKNLTCIYGKCFYCKKEDPICADLSGNLVGTVILNLDVNLKNNRSPWQRTYKNNKKALWEIKDDYCKSLNGKISKKRLYDLVDTAIFDFLIQNGDRHHYETLDDRVVWIDNGKGLGNPNIHHIDILAPLYQCCMLRADTWTRLQALAGGMLSEKIRKMPDLEEIIWTQHFAAMDQRLLIIFATVEFCKNKNKENHGNQGF